MSLPTHSRQAALWLLSPSFSLSFSRCSHLSVCLDSREEREKRNRMREKKKDVGGALEWEVGTCAVAKGNPWLSVVDPRLHGSRGQASWSVCLCLWARGEIQWPCSAATWKALDALMRRNYCACVFTRLRGSEEEREWISTFQAPCVYSPSSQILRFSRRNSFASLPSKPAQPQSIDLADWWLSRPVMLVLFLEMLSCRLVWHAARLVTQSLMCRPRGWEDSKIHQIQI